MSMAVTRFEIRKQLVLEKANAIRTNQLRTHLLPAAEGQEIVNLLRAYVNIRIPAVAYGQRHPNPELTSLLLQSLNRLIDLDAARWMAFQDQVPGAVICVIAAVGLLAAMVLGYTFGLGGLRRPTNPESARRSAVA